MSSMNSVSNLILAVEECCHKVQGMIAVQKRAAQFTIKRYYWARQQINLPRTILSTSSFAHCACSATSPSFPYMSNPALDSSLCRAAAPRLRPLQLLLPDCIGPLQLLLPVGVHFSCCTPIVSTSAAACRLRPLQLLLPNCVRFGCCSPIVSTCSLIASACNTSCSSPMFSNIFMEVEVKQIRKYEGRALLV